MLGPQRLGPAGYRLVRGFLLEREGQLVVRRVIASRYDAVSRQRRNLATAGVIRIGSGTRVAHNRPVPSSSRHAVIIMACGLLATSGCGEVLGADFKDAKRNECGPDRAGRTNEGGACEGPNMQLAAMFHHTCALMHDQVVWCWGENKFGEVGDGTNEFRANPVRVPDLPPVIAIGAGEGHNCAI